MTRIVNVSQSDYRVKVQSGGTITLDVGVSPGVVVITGDLDVKGTTTTIESINTTVKDNILTLNYGESNYYVTLGTAGLRIDRGDAAHPGSFKDALLIFDESVYHYDPVSLTSVPGTFVLKTTDNNLSGIQVASVGTANNDLVFDMQNSSYKVRIANSVGYELLITQDNDITTKKWVESYVASTGGYADVDNFHYLAAPFQTRGQAYNNNIQFTVMNALRTQITQTGLFVDNVNTYQNEIKTINSSGVNLKLSSDTNLLEINAIAGLNNQTVLSNGSVDATKTKLYASATAGPGKTGLYFLNKRTGEPGQSINETVNDELVAKNRALLFSMLF
jgi:hypothetical protein